jgi:uncharacterized protein HemX
MKRGIVVLLLVSVLGAAMVGCGDFQRQATEIRTRIENAETTAQTAEDAAARNTGKLIELERRIEALEAALDAVEAQMAGKPTP